MNHSVNGDSQQIKNSQRIKMYTTDWCSSCWRAKQVMQSMQVDFVEINISHDPEAAALVEAINNGYRSVPTLLVPDGSVLTEPSTTELVNKISMLAGHAD